VRLFPVRQRRRVATVSHAVTQKVSAWMGGQLLLSLVIGLTSAIGLGAMGVPYFYVLALISAVGEMIPMVGPILAAIPAILVAATVSPGLAIGVAIFFIAQQQLENTILVPKLMGRQVGLSAVTVIIALGVGSQLLGVVGAILSVPTAAILQVLFEELVARDE
jgi:predicted PurR-regulated permease PerM